MLELSNKTKFLRPNLTPNQDKSETGGVKPKEILTKEKLQLEFDNLSKVAQILVFETSTYREYVPKEFILSHLEEFYETDGENNFYEL